MGELADERIDYMCFGRPRRHRKHNSDYYRQKEAYHNKMWLSKSGPIKISEMTSSHLAACIRLLKKKSTYFDFEELLKEELKRRGMLS